MQFQDLLLFFKRINLSTTICKRCYSYPNNLLATQNKCPKLRFEMLCIYLTYNKRRSLPMETKPDYFTKI